MKALSLFLAMTFSLSTMAEDFKIVPALNGTRIPCEILGDVGKRTFQLEVKETEVLEEEYVARIAVKYIACDRIDGKFQFVDHALDEATYRNVLDDNGQLAKAKFETVYAHLNAVDINDRLIKKYVMNLSESTEEIEVRFAKNQKSVFFLMQLKSKVLTPQGVVIPDIFEYLGGLVLRVTTPAETK